MNVCKDIITNKYIYIPLFIWFGIQIYKVICDSIKNKKFSLKRLWGAGGMPSSHTAVVVGLSTLIGKYEGTNTAIFAVSIVFALIVMYDAAGVRRAAGKQAQVLNKIIEDPEIVGDVQIQEKLVEVLGHTPIQVLAGAVIGVIVGIIC